MEITRSGAWWRRLTFARAAAAVGERALPSEVGRKEGARRDIERGGGASSSSSSPLSASGWSACAHVCRAPQAAWPRLSAAFVYSRGGGRFSHCAPCIAKTLAHSLRHGSRPCIHGHGRATFTSSQPSQPSQPLRLRLICPSRALQNV